MKVLLLQEMSGVHKELKKGLEQLGIETKIAAQDYGFRKYGSDINLGSVSGSLYSHVERAMNQIVLATNFKKYDVVQTISPNPFYSPLNNVISSILSHTNCKSVYIAAGSDAIYRKHVRELDYYPPHDWFEDLKKYESLKSKLEKFDSIVPVCWEYKYSMEQAGFSTKPIIPFPVDIYKFSPVSRKGRRKIRFFHPLNRSTFKYDFKGTLIIQEAFKELESKYSDVAEFICKGGMTHQEYDLFTDDIDVIVDQVYSYSYGMSAALGLAKGKVVISGLEMLDGADHFKRCPVINVKPDVFDLISKIEYLIMNSNQLEKLQSESREFAEKYHCSVEVAKSYIQKVYS